MIGSRLGRFEISGKLGEGGMGEVYRASDTRLGRDVAIKVLPETFVGDAERLARFEREARALARLDHPNIAGIHEIGEDEEMVFLVLELVPGETLAERLASRRPTTREALEIARDIARALEAAHERGIVHRDLKPQNVKITPDGEVKLLDFGLAKSVDAPGADARSMEASTVTAGLTATGTAVGTAPYMSPEQVRGASVDERTDIWAFGCVLYEMLTGERPFAGPSAADTLVAILREDPDWSAPPADLPSGVESLLRRCLEKEEARRPGRIADARSRIEAVLGATESGELLSGPDPAVPTEALPAEGAAAGREVPPSPGRRPRLAFAGIGALLLLAAIWLGWGYVAAPESGAGVTDRSIAVLPFETLGTDEPSTFTDGVHGDILTRLSKVPELSVTSRTSTMQFRRPEGPLPEIARLLGVTWILLGEVQEAGDRVQVNARLVHAPEDQQVWAESYRRRLTAENVFEIQEEITEQIARQLEARLAPGESRAAARTPTENLEAYRLYVEGRALLDERSADAMRRAIDRFRSATELDPEFALAWVGVAETSALLEAYGFAAEASPLAAGFEAVAKALELDPELAEAHAARGLLLANSGRRSEARQAIERAVELRPSYAEAHSWMSVGDRWRGFPEEALASAERAAELNPLSVEVLSNLALSALASGDDSRALREALRMQAVEPEYETGRFIEAVARYHLGEYEAARSLLEGLSIPWAGSGPEALLAISELRSDGPDRVRVRLATFEEREEHFGAGLVHAALGDHDEAFAAFDRVEEWSQWPITTVRYLLPDVLDPLRRDPRWADLMRLVDES